MNLKPGVQVRQLSTQCLFGMVVTLSVFGRWNKKLTITSGDEGTHGYKSAHYRGDAWDFRTKHLSPEEKRAIVAEIAESLGPDYDVILENEGNDNEHGHGEFDPKGRHA